MIYPSPRHKNLPIPPRPLPGIDVPQRPTLFEEVIAQEVFEVAIEFLLRGSAVEIPAARVEQRTGETQAEQMLRRVQIGPVDGGFGVDAEGDEGVERGENDGRVHLSERDSQIVKEIGFESHLHIVVGE